jgi:hypothetical protein
VTSAAADLEAARINRASVTMNCVVHAEIELSGGRGRQRCNGPVFDSLCPRAASDGRVPCAGGRILLLHGTWADSTWLQVDEHAGPECPMAGLVMVVPQPWD